jgi:hypothetical protein
MRRSSAACIDEGGDAFPEQRLRWRNRVGSSGKTCEV